MADYSDFWLRGLFQHSLLPKHLGNHVVHTVGAAELRDLGVRRLLGPHSAPLRLARVDLVQRHPHTPHHLPPRPGYGYVVD